MLQCGYFLLEAAKLGLGEEPWSLSPQSLDLFFHCFARSLGASSLIVLFYQGQDALLYSWRAVASIGGRSRDPWAGTFPSIAGPLPQRWVENSEL
jgi:hypothetical protein